MNKPREDCAKVSNGREWAYCAACNGRIHEPACTSRRDRLKDCCQSRHEYLAGMGYTAGLADSSLPMLGTHARRA